MTVDVLYDTLTLLEVQRVQKPPTTYWLDLCFPRQFESGNAKIMFDDVVELRRMAPFVAPNVQGRVMKEQGYTTRTFLPAYIKPKHAVDPSRAIPRMAGDQPLVATPSPEQRYNALIAENMRLEKDMIMRRWEWMAAKAVVDGEVTVSGEDYPSQTVDFGRDSSLDNTLTSGARWSQNTATPLQDIRDLRKAVFNKSRSAITRLTFGTDAWDYFLSFSEVTDLLNALRRGSDTNINMAVAEGLPYEFMGRISGQNGMGGLDLYVYSDATEDIDGNETDIIDPLDVVFTGPGVNGVRCFGAIQDRRAGLQSLAMFPKMWDDEDPSVTYTMTQSAPLMVPAQPNACARLRVA